MHHVYIIYSDSKSQFYCGECADMADRLERHNGNRSKSTKGKGPWRVIKTFEHVDRKEARAFESKIKKRGIQRFLNDIDLSFPNERIKCHAE